MFFENAAMVYLSVFQICMCTSTGDIGCRFHVRMYFELLLTMYTCTCMYIAVDHESFYAEKNCIDRNSNTGET